MTEESVLPWLQGPLDLTALTAEVADPVLARRGRDWWIAAGVSAFLTLIMVAAMAYSFENGVGAWGNNTSVVWGFPIANYVYWIGIGNAGTLISALLLVTRQKWRASINRFAEAMTLFAISIAGIFPILHLGRPMYFYWLAPYPDGHGLWPQWRSALVWDFWAILSYLLFSIIFFYVGLIPDLATLRDRARSRTAAVIFGLLAVGWRGSIRHWRAYERLVFLMACMAVPLVCSVHSIVGLDFAASLMPGWKESIFPPYFVVGALFSGFAMVVLLAAWLRRALDLTNIITTAHFEAMARVLLAASIVMGLSYATEWFSAWYGGQKPDFSELAFTFGGPYRWLYFTMLFGNVIAPQVLWLRRARTDTRVLVIVAILINIGMWLERILIILDTLSHGHLPSAWRLFTPTLIDIAILTGSFGFFALLMLMFSRLLPVVSMHDMRKLLAQEGLA
ncbi:MAG TPA: NrfD/PsrC family molybdoenzyme membrane anchor subunit [Caulobacteraceae bacterium]|nr:NrfD/PsrC family molybdoenzyme membrane anchor subunit [Caulobacteraceae bacterium]